MLALDHIALSRGGQFGHNEPPGGSLVGFDPLFDERVSSNPTDPNLHVPGPPICDAVRAGVSRSRMSCRAVPGRGWVDPSVATMWYEK
jgi:hypothetical protein